MKKQIIALLAGAMLMLATSAMATSYGFTQLASSSSLSNVAGQLSVDITESNSGTLFKFTNAGALTSVITAIYFDYGTPFPMTYVGMTDSGDDVDFAVGATPSNLAGGNTISFESGWATDAESPAPNNGINNNTGSLEWLSIEFSGQSFNEIINDLNDNTLRIGLHVQAQADGLSAEYVSGAAPVPEPGTMMLFGIGMLGLAVYGKRRMNKEA